MKQKKLIIKTKSQKYPIIIGTNLVEKLSQIINIKTSEIKSRINNLYESNPMLGHRGCRLGIIYPEITEMQSKAIFEATAKLVKEGHKPFPEVMIPLVGSGPELKNQKQIVLSLAEETMQTKKSYEENPKPKF